MIDRMQVMVEARQGDFARAQSAPIGEPAVDQQNVEPGAGQIGAENKSVVSGADDDAVIGFFQRLGQIRTPCSWPTIGSNAALDCRGRSVAVNGPSSRAEYSGTAALFDLPCGELGRVPYGGRPFGVCAATLEYQNE